MSKIAQGFVISLVCCAFLAGAAAAKENIVVNGSTTVLPISQATAEAYMKRNPGVNISISGGGSGNGIKALIDRTTRIANSSRPMKKEEEQLAASKGVKPVAHTVAIDALTPVVHPTNPVNDLTLEQLSLIYQGKITNWKEVGGKDMKIIVISRDTSSGTYESWQEKVLHREKVTPRAQLQASSGAVVQVISKNRYAIGYVGIGYVNKSVKALTVNGVEASAKNALDGTYSIARPLYMFTDGQPTGAVADYIRFVLSPEGQKIVKQQGFVPVK
ncbi:MAG: phosphate ABC transporter substrate-binding protein [Deltaproteobacteria bacterium]|nr:phosphate ABC transporter substrate-binding protein [Deltaproteobacteria bacterium]